MIIVTGAVVARPETFERIMSLSREHVARSRREPGCISHEVCVSADDPLRLVFFERWTGADALKAHFAVSESRAFVSEVRALCVGATEMQVYAASEVAV
ncbi:MAG: putative quinol monooxygenase [Hyphomonadaceae bacterium]